MPTSTYSTYHYIYNRLCSFFSTSSCLRHGCFGTESNDKLVGQFVPEDIYCQSEDDYILGVRGPDFLILRQGSNRRCRRR